jgi:hypothetical protein
MTSKKNDMRKLFLSLGLLLAVAVSWASVQHVCDVVSLEVRIIDPTPSNPVPRTPVLVPTVSLDGYTLSYDASCWGDTLQLVQDGVIVYSTVIPSNANSMILPSYLSGKYELQIIRGNLCFYGDITL